CHSAFSRVHRDGGTGPTRPPRSCDGDSLLQSGGPFMLLRSRCMRNNDIDATARVAIAIVVVAEFLGTSLWFSANAAADDLRHAWGLAATDLGALTSAVQLGFISGTLVFALSGLADRYAASRIFAVCAAAGAAANAGFALATTGVADGCAWRFAT